MGVEPGCTDIDTTTYQILSGYDYWFGVVEPVCEHLVITHASLRVRGHLVGVQSDIVATPCKISS